MKKYQIAFVTFIFVFAALLLTRIGLWERMFSDPMHIPQLSAKHPPQRDTWMNIFQSGRKIGYSHSTFIKIINGYQLQETMYLKINTMGLVQDVHIRTKGKLNPDLSLSSFEFALDSGRFAFAASGLVEGQRLLLETKTAGTSQRYDIQLKGKPYLAAGLVDVAVGKDLKAGQSFTLDIFDPTTLTQTPVVIRSLGQEEILYKGQPQKTTKVALEFKGTTQLAWIDADGQVLREKGLLGITLEKTTRKGALRGLKIEPSLDMTLKVSVEAKTNIADPASLLRLKVEINGIDPERIQLDGGRQVFADPVLTITKERMSDVALTSIRFDQNEIDPEIDRFLKPSPFIQSDDPHIKGLAREIVSGYTQPLEQIAQLVAWLQQNIQKRPVISVPNAKATLSNRMGDCNEYAVLMAAFARAVGIPAKIETGLVYLNGRFYYHAWNALYLGTWITVDALFDQIPADVTHIRLSSGAQEQQLDLMNVIGKIELNLLNLDGKDTTHD